MNNNIKLIINNVGGKIENENFFERNELAIRHHQALNGTQPVFERQWHFLGNHFAIIDKNKLPVFNTVKEAREKLRTLMTGRFADIVYEITL